MILKDKNIEPSFLLVISETYVPTILYQYHDSLLARHQGVTRMYLTLKEKIYANNLFNSIRKYIQSCHTCHTRSAEEPGCQSYHTRILYDFRSMFRISADIKWMPLSNQGVMIRSSHRNGVLPSIPNIKHVHMCIVLMTNRVIYDDENKPHPQWWQLCT